jgi:hypothetical protein
LFKSTSPKNKNKMALPYLCKNTIKFKKY